MAIVDTKFVFSIAEELKNLLDNDYFTTELSDDVIGVEIGAAVKNVLAVGVGLVNGAGFSENTKALLFTKGFQEVIELAFAIGGNPETLCGLSGLGDSVLTCMGSQSRNVKTGILLGQGETIENILKETGMIPEGINTVKSICELSRKFDVQMPICSGIYDVVFNGKSVKDFLQQLV